MYPDVANLKKRKFFGGTIEDLSLPAQKHKCNVGIGSHCDTLMMKALNRVDAYNLVNKGADAMDILETRVNATQSRNNLPGDSWSSAEVKFDAGFGKTDSFDGASTSGSNSRSEISRFESVIVSNLRDGKEEVIFSKGDCQDMGWRDSDCLEDCLSAEHRKQLTAEGLEGFLSSSGVDASLFDQSSGIWNVDQETQLGRQRPTIDQEFEQYFSMLML